MGKSSGEDVGSVTNRAIALVYELQLLFVCGRWTRTPQKDKINDHQLCTRNQTCMSVCVFMQNLYIYIDDDAWW